MPDTNYLVKAWLTGRQGTDTGYKLRDVMRLDTDPDVAWEQAEKRLATEHGARYHIDFDLVHVGELNLADVRGTSVWDMEDGS